MCMSWFSKIKSNLTIALSPGFPRQNLNTAIEFFKFMFAPLLVYINRSAVFSDSEIEVFFVLGILNRTPTLCFDF